MEPSTAEAAAFTEIELYELDGIPLAYLPMAGSTMLTLVFGVGRAHEPVTRGGMTHLIEHILMTSVADRLDRSLDHSNGTTEPFRVTFSLRGSPRDASRFLAELCQVIERPPLGRMWQEVNVLRTEAAGRGGSGLSFRSIWYRTGYQGIGTSNLPELFLHAPDEDALRAWIAEHMTAGNAAIWIAGELPDDLLVTLPPGPRHPVPAPAWVPGLATPTIVRDSVPGIGASFLVERSTATVAGLRALDRRLRHSMRVERGLGYDVGGDYMAVSADQAVATVWATCLPKNVEEVERTVLEAIDDLAARGPNEDELQQQYERHLRDVSDPMSTPGRLDAHVRDVLLGGPVRTTAQLLEEQWRLQPADVAEALRRARDSMLLLIPEEGFIPQRHFERYPGPDLAPVGRGRTFDLAAAKGGAPWRKAKAPKLTVGDAGVAVDDPAGGRMVGIPWSDTVAVLSGMNFRTVVSRDGSTFVVEASEWKDGRGAVGLVDQFAPGDRVVRMTE
jgi:hypothetical protein